MAKRILGLVAEYADAVVALVLAVVFGFLGILGAVSPQAVGGAILATLAVLAIALLRDRANKVALDRDVRRATAFSRDVLGALPGRLERIDILGEAISELRSVVEGSGTVRTLRGNEVEAALENARQTTDRWYFKGGTGTYNRAVTLPRCVDNARRNRRPLQIRLEIVDPTNAAVCERYAMFRGSVSLLPDGTGEFWTRERTRLESYATIVAACWYRERYNLLDIQVGLASSISSFRYDMASDVLVITQDDAAFPALLVSRDKPLFDAYAVELRTSFDQARKVDLDLAAASPLGVEPTTGNVRDLLDRLGLTPQPPLDEQVLATVLEKAIHAKNPYV